MPVFTPPSRNAVPSVLPPWTGREAQTVTGWRLFRHYRSRPEGINVFLLSDGTVTEDDPDGTSVHWLNENDGNPYVQVAWYGGHDDYNITEAQKTLLVAAGYGAYITG